LLGSFRYSVSEIALTHARSNYGIEWSRAVVCNEIITIYGVLIDKSERFLLVLILFILSSSDLFITGRCL